MHPPAPLRRPFATGGLVLAGLAAAVLTAPAAAAMTDPTAGPSAPVTTGPVRLTTSPVSYLGTPDEPVALTSGSLLVGVGEEQGNELGYPVDLGGATVRVTITPAPEDGGPAPTEVYGCTTDDTGSCAFTDADGEFLLGVLSGDVVTVEQLTAPASGQFTLPPAEDRVVHGVVPATQDVQPDRTTPVADESTPGDVRGFAPDVLSRRATWNQVVFFQPLAPADDTDPTAGGSVPDVPAPDLPPSDLPGAQGTEPAAPAAGTAGTAGAAAASGATTQHATAGATPTAPPAGEATSGRPAGLATTGSDVLPVAALGGVLLAAGTCALAAARRRAAR